MTAKGQTMTPWSWMLSGLSPAWRLSILRLRIGRLSEA